MKAINKKHSITITSSVKSVSLILLTSLLFACQGESSAESKTAAVAADAVETSSALVDKATESVSKTADVHGHGHAHDEMSEKKEEMLEPTTPKGPADYSTLQPNTYKSVSEPFAVSSGDNIEVTELFWFGCGHCFALEPHIKSWLKNKPANAKFKKVPAIFSKRWEFHGKAFYTMEALDVPDKAYDAFFRQIHVVKRGINNLADLVKFLEPYNKEKELVESTFNSFAVDTQFRNAVKITKASGATGVPAMIVDGKYLTSQSDAGGTKEMFDVIDKLVAKAADEK